MLKIATLPVKMSGLTLIVGFAMSPLVLLAQMKSERIDCSATLKNDVLTLENGSIARTFEWNNGNIITLSLTDKKANKIWRIESNKTDLSLPAQTAKATNSNFSTSVVPATAVAPKHLQAEVTYTLDKLQIKRVFRLYPGCPAIACDLYFRGQASGKWIQSQASLADMVNLEKLTLSSGDSYPVIEKLALPGKHWKMNAVEFLDVTDRNNNLVFEVNALSYRPNLYRGNLLFAQDNTSGNGIFILKEAPTSSVQLAYPGADFLTEYGTFRVIGCGLNPLDLHPTEWKRGYGFVTGVFAGDEGNRFIALREYQKNRRAHLPERDEMVLMNTWGDRAQDLKVREKFTLLELEAGAKLSITHFQIDDGWQSGRSANSALKGGSFHRIWDNPAYWTPDHEKFPNGLQPVVKRGKELGIEICLWFNPSGDSSNADWEKDADALIGLYNQYGIRTFKIDGVNLPDKGAEINFRKFLDKVSRSTNGNVVFNLDVTAGRRGGYHYFNEYGNLFLENRYTDWQNYYPYTTLRNLWMLSKYVPAENLQIEFLNKWRNKEKYTDDPFAPANYSFEYLFALTMAAQPLAWFEGTGLPEEAFTTVAPVIKKYRSIQADFHRGKIFPIGDEPSGKSWTGFQSIQDGRGYFLVYREAAERQQAGMKTWLPKGKSIKCTPLLGSGKAFTATTRSDGTITFELPEKNSYALYRYTVEK
jgi:hypothetical protein